MIKTENNLVIVSGSEGAICGLNSIYNVALLGVYPEELMNNKTIKLDEVKVAYDGAIGMRSLECKDIVLLFLAWPVNKGLDYAAEQIVPWLYKKTNEFIIGGKTFNVLKDKTEDVKQYFIDYFKDKI